MDREKPKPRKSTLEKLRLRKTRFREQVMYDAKLKSLRCCLWFAADCITMDNTALEYENSGMIVINPSQKGIAIWAGVSINTANAAIASAIERGHLERLFRGSGTVGNSEYRVVLKKRTKQDPK